MWSPALPKLATVQRDHNSGSWVTRFFDCLRCKQFGQLIQTGNTRKETIGELTDVVARLTKAGNHV